MSIMRMRKMFHQQRKVKVGKRRITLPSAMAIVFGLMIVIFVVGSYYSFGGRGRDNASAPGQAKLSSIVAKVGGEAVTRAHLQMLVDQQTKMMPGASSLAMQWQASYGVFQQLAEQMLLLQAAKREGIKVTSADLNKEIDARVQEQIAQRFPKREKLFDYLQSHNLSQAQLETQTRKELAMDPAPLRDSLMVKGLQAKIESTVQLTDDQLKNYYTELQVSHILINPKKLQAASAKPAAAKPGQPAPAPATPLTAEQADQQAKAKADQIATQLTSGADFAALAKQDSDDQGSAVKGGDLGWVKRGMMVPEFDQQIFTMTPGQVSPVFKSQFGYHIAKVLASRSTLPKDFEQNKASYRTQVEGELKSQAWQAYVSKLKDGGQIQIIDAELRAHQTLEQGDLEGTQTLLAQAAQDDPQNAAVRWMLANLAMEKQNWPVAIQYLDQASKLEHAASDPSIWMMLGEAQEKAGDKAKALEAYMQASDRAGAPSFPNMSMHTQLKTKFKDLGRADLIKQETDWLADFQKTQKEKGAMGGLNLQDLQGLGGAGGNLQIP
ncbi:MAG TPA: peptidylprolyl isomerase [Armatimonadota bacterium]|jgi:hypothetical protein